MIDVLDGVRDHYRAIGLTERLRTALAAFRPEDQQLTPQQLAALDQFHTCGLAAAAELGKLAGITTEMSVLDVGSGVGGPACFLAETYGCVMLNGDDPHYPLPWARTPATSFPLTAAARHETIDRAGFRILTWQDDMEAAKAWFAQLHLGPAPFAQPWPFDGARHRRKAGCAS